MVSELLIILNSQRVRYHNTERHADLLHIFSRFADEQFLVKDFAHEIGHLNQSALDGKFVRQVFFHTEINNEGEKIQQQIAAKSLDRMDAKRQNIEETL